MCKNGHCHCHKSSSHKLNSSIQLIRLSTFLVFSFHCGIAYPRRKQDEQSAACRRVVAESLVREVAFVVDSKGLVRKSAFVVVPESLVREGCLCAASVASPQQPLIASTIASLSKQALPQRAKRQRQSRRHRQGKRNGLPSLFGLLLHKRKF